MEEPVYIQNLRTWIKELRYSAYLYRRPEYLDMRKAKLADKWADKLERRAKRFLDKCK